MRLTDVMSLVSAIAIIYVVIAALFFAGQRRFIFFPTREITRAPAEEIRLGNAGETLKIWKKSGTGADAVIYFGGNAEDVAGSISELSAGLPQHTVYLVNYRGYGGSSGSPSESALYSDALAVHDYLSARHSRISVIGRSLGSAVAVYLASQKNVDRLVLVTPFDSIINVAGRLLPIFPTSLVVREKFDALRYVPQVTAPVLAIIAEQDEVINRRHSDNLIAAFPSAQISVEIIKGATHNSIDLFPAYMQNLSAFLNTADQEIELGT